jgi:hypothetical protein
MKYAIKELTDKYNLFKSERNLKALAIEYKNGAKFLKGEEFNGFNVPTVQATLSELKSRIQDGLNSWGENYQEQKKRQEKRLQEVNEALIKLKNI